MVDLARILIDLYLEHQAATKALKHWKEVLRSVTGRVEFTRFTPLFKSNYTDLLDFR